jgi:alginate O-acetyltransferase complex protein AlgI
MLFNSLEFAIFFPVVTILYFILPHRFRWALLLTASCVFYMAFIPVYILILIFTIIVDYFAGIWIANASGRRRRFALRLSIVANCGVLAFFKYYNFLNVNLTRLLGGVHLHNSLPVLSIILPIGLSFHTFQAMSYTIEVYRGRQQPVKHFGIYALYVMFYPQLVAGPIERPQNLIHQFLEHHSFDYRRVTDGLKLMLWGLYKKVVIADGLSLYVDPVYNHLGQYRGMHMLAATVFFAIEIYCDFSGYSDIAIGVARVMDFKLMTNFNSPYAARSISEFWRRWHISLSTWFRDYLYIPIGGNKVPVTRWYFNILFTFLVSGLWHGANWTFVVWGALNGVYILVGIWTKRTRTRLASSTGMSAHPTLYKILQVTITFALVCFAWIFFRANNFTDALYVIKHIVTDVPSRGFLVGMGRREFAMLVLSIAAMEIVQVTQRRKDFLALLASQPTWIRWTIYYGLVFAILLFGQFGKKQFIYFQF